MQPYYTIMKLPGEKQTEFIQMLPFTPRAKDNLAAWMVARSDGEHYGHICSCSSSRSRRSSTGRARSSAASTRIR